MKQKHTKYTQINLRTVKWALCDKTQSIHTYIFLPHHNVVL